MNSDSSVPLRLEQVDKSLAGRLIVSALSFEAPAGTITALLGPNGAGKTTSVTLATGLRRPDSGRVDVFGIPAGSAVARQRFSLVPQEVTFPAPVTVRHCLDFVERQRTPSRFGPSRELICHRLGLIELLSRSTGALSGGQRRRLSVALGFVRVPGLLILDEATTNLDEDSRRTVWQLAHEYATNGGAVLVTSHILADIDAYASRVVALADGRVVRQGSLSQLRAALGGSTVSVTVNPSVRAAILARVAEHELGQLVRSDAPSDAGSVSWRTQRPAELAALIAALEPTAADLTINPTPLAELLADLTRPDGPKPDKPKPDKPKPDPAGPAGPALRGSDREVCR